MSGTDGILVGTVLVDMNVLNVVVGDDHSDGSAGGEIIFHHSGEDVDEVFFLAGGIERSLTGFALVEFRLNHLSGDSDSRGNAVDDDHETAVKLGRDGEIFSEAAGIGFAAAGDFEESSKCVSEHVLFSRDKFAGAARYRTSII